MGLWRPLRASETMSELGVLGLRHFTMPLRVLGGASGITFGFILAVCSTDNVAGTFSVRDDGTVIDANGWEQGALNPDGTSKSAAEIDFGQDPGTPPSKASGMMTRYCSSKSNLVLRIATKPWEGCPPSGRFADRRRGTV